MSLSDNLQIDKSTIRPKTRVRNVKYSAFPQVTLSPL